jgi:subtilase family serine protease
MFSARLFFFRVSPAARAGVSLARPSAVLAATVLVGMWQPAHAAAEPTDSVATRRGPSSATLVKAEDPSAIINVSIWLNPRNKDQLDALARELYDPTSPNYRHWLKSADIASRFAPTEAQVGIVREFFEAQNLKVVKVGPKNFYVRARGAAADVERAFHVKLNYYKNGNQTLRTSNVKPSVAGPAAEVVYSISGLSDMQYQHSLAVVARRGAARVGVSTSDSAMESAAGADSASLLAKAAIADDTSLFETVCFTGPKTEHLLGVSIDGSPKGGTFHGNGYNNGTAGCAYAPANLYKAYGLDKLYAEGYNGAGQTIAIIDWCGSPTVQQDANAFSKRFGLPALTAVNFQIVKPDGASQCSAPDLEINLDVEWAHAIAPGANIALVVPPTASLDDIDESWFYVVNQGLANVISGSYGAEEAGLLAYNQQGELQKENLIAEIGAVQGIASNFSTGDNGEYCEVEGSTCSVNIPADLPYATAIGGVSLALNADNTIAFQTGWESYASLLDYGANIQDPPLPGSFETGSAFQGGSGGGASQYFAKPSFQKTISGTHRQLPDISWLADPFTGVAVYITLPFQYPPQEWLAVGGTSVSCPLFSALWAIANQEAGTALGQAAPYLYSMPAGTITDIVPHASSDNVAGQITAYDGTIDFFNASAALGVTEPQFGTFYSVLWDEPLDTGYTSILSFGADYMLKVKAGWDDVTGLGTPNAKAFADWFHRFNQSSAAK